tara:strand:- start:217 stop:1812 length:1596 start_codon:yes stop_codon:yes gene_type:complete
MLSYYVFWGIFSFFITLALSLLLLNYVKISHFLDSPDNERKLHNVTVPRYGGIAFSFSILLGIIGLFKFDSQYFWVYISFVLVITLGILDDLFRLSWRVKMLVQVITGSIVFSAIKDIIPEIQFFSFSFTLPFIPMFLLFLLWFVGMMNSVNLVDGMDGLAGGMVFITFMGLAYLGWFFSNSIFLCFCLVVICSLYAFLIFNAKPAKFFMGDTGSLFLGLLLAISPILFYFTNGAYISLDITPFLMFFSYLIFDTLRVFYYRAKKKKNPLTPDRQHFHHLILDKLGSYNATLFYIYLLMGLFILLGILMLKLELTIEFGLLYLLFMILFIISTRFLKSILGIFVMVRKWLRGILMQVNPKQFSFSHLIFKIIFLIYILSHFILFYMIFPNSKWLVLLLVVTILAFVMQYFFQRSNLGTIVYLGVHFFILFFLSKTLVDIGINMFFILLVFKYIILCGLLLMMIRYMVRYSVHYLMRFWKNSDMLIIICLFISLLYVFIFNSDNGLISSICLELLLIFIFFRSSFLDLKVKT